MQPAGKSPNPDLGRCTFLEASPAFLPACLRHCVDCCSTLEIEVSRDETKNLPNLVAQLETEGVEKLGVLNIEMSISTLQEVFLRIVCLAILNEIA